MYSIGLLPGNCFRIGIQTCTTFNLTTVTEKNLALSMCWCKQLNQGSIRIMVLIVGSNHPEGPLSKVNSNSGRPTKLAVPQEQQCRASPRNPSTQVLLMGNANHGWDISTPILIHVVTSWFKGYPQFCFRFLDVMFNHASGKQTTDK